MSAFPDCTCGLITDPDANPICGACERRRAEVMRHLYETDPEIRAELDRLGGLDSPAGRGILGGADEVELFLRVLAEGPGEPPRFPA